MATAFVFDPDTSYGRVEAIRNAMVMPVGVRYVASVTGPWKIFAVVEFADLGQLAGRVDGVSGSQEGGSGDPETALSFDTDKVRRSEYKEHTALVRIETDVPDPATLLPQIADALEIDLDDLEADVVVGDFDILVCLVDEDGGALGPMVLKIRGVSGVLRTVTLRVIDYVSASVSAPDDGQHRIPGQNLA